MTWVWLINRLRERERGIHQGAIIYQAKNYKQSCDLHKNSCPNFKISHISFQNIPLKTIAWLLLRSIPKHWHLRIYKWQYILVKMRGIVSLFLSVNFIVDMQPMVLLKVNAHIYNSKSLKLNYGYLTHLWHQLFSKE